MAKQTLREKIAEIEQRVQKLEQGTSAQPCGFNEKRLLTREEAAQFLGMTIDGLRGLTYKKLISYYKPNGKNIYFDVDELVAWQKKNHFEPLADIRDGGC